MRIGIDLMGSDSSPEILFKAVSEVSDLVPHSITFVVFLTNEVASILAKEYQTIPSRIDFFLVKDFISMEEAPLTAVRLKKNASMLVGIEQVHKKTIDVFITAGNTGALIAGSTLLLDLMKPFERLALLALLPTRKNKLVVLDVGANTTGEPRHFVHYAKMGAAYQRCVLNIEVPKIGLLNIGTESKKGTIELREAFRLLQESLSLRDSKMEFMGNIEPREIFQGNIDVLVTDGFTGNVLLKTSEGISSYIFETIQEAEKSSFSSLDTLQKNFNYEEHPGALVCGIEGLVIKCHGTATLQAMKNSILGGISLAQNNFIQKMRLAVN